MTDIEWDGARVLARIRAATMAGLEVGAEHLLQVSSSLAPHEEGDLERSGEVSKDEDGLVVAVSFDRPYAARQHEDMTYRHDAGRKAKFLEEPMHGEKPTVLALIHQRARRELGET
ncbi:minor capsid protein [Polymorphospora rubra]|uniref:HK97 gp10 family phage protein n=1 Tax=Polymorphospora rubra TaxID=338584 RepID=A0A810MVZ4_9ACTN|nr:minor capsid protein [Polymorphospora rubra]BCJ64149.1 hypothetical protein Prubr_11700 [Polymorphospora rubra]